MAEMIYDDIEDAGLANTDPSLVRKVQALSDMLVSQGHNPVNITGGWRSPTHNAEVGGDPDSWHLYGRAIDFVVDDDIPDSAIKQYAADNGLYALKHDVETGMHWHFNTKEDDDNDEESDPVINPLLMLAAAASRESYHVFDTSNIPVDSVKYEDDQHYIQPLEGTWDAMLANFMDSAADTGFWSMVGLARARIFNSGQGLTYNGDLLTGGFELKEHAGEYQITEEDVEYVRKLLPNDQNAQDFILRQAIDRQEIEYLTSRAVLERDRKIQLEQWKKENDSYIAGFFVGAAGAGGYMADPLNYVPFSRAVSGARAALPALTNMAKAAKASKALVPLVEKEASLVPVSYISKMNTALVPVSQSLAGKAMRATLGPNAIANVERAAAVADKVGVRLAPILQSGLEASLGYSADIGLRNATTGKETTAKEYAITAASAFVLGSTLNLGAQVWPLIKGTSAEKVVSEALEGAEKAETKILSLAGNWADEKHLLPAPMKKLMGNRAYNNAFEKYKALPPSATSHVDDVDYDAMFERYVDEVRKTNPDLAEAEIERRATAKVEQVKHEGHVARRESEATKEEARKNMAERERKQQAAEETMTDVNGQERRRAADIEEEFQRELREGTASDEIYEEVRQGINRQRSRVGEPPLKDIDETKAFFMTKSEKGWQPVHYGELGEATHSYVYALHNTSLLAERFSSDVIEGMGNNMLKVANRFVKNGMLVMPENVEGARKILEKMHGIKVGADDAFTHVLTDAGDDYYVVWRKLAADEQTSLFRTMCKNAIDKDPKLTKEYKKLLEAIEKPKTTKETVKEVKYTKDGKRVEKTKTKKTKRSLTDKEKNSMIADFFKKVLDKMSKSMPKTAKTIAGMNEAVSSQFNNAASYVPQKESLKAAIEKGLQEDMDAEAKALAAEMKKAMTPEGWKEYERQMTKNAMDKLEHEQGVHWNNDGSLTYGGAPIRPNHPFHPVVMNDIDVLEHFDYNYDRIELAKLGVDETKNTPRLPKTSKKHPQVFMQGEDMVANAADTTSDIYRSSNPEIMLRANPKKAAQREAEAAARKAEEMRAAREAYEKKYATKEKPVDPKVAERNAGETAEEFLQRVKEEVINNIDLQKSEWWKKLPEFTHPLLSKFSNFLDQGYIGMCLHSPSKTMRHIAGTLWKDPRGRELPRLLPMDLETAKMSYFRDMINPYIDYVQLRLKWFDSQGKRYKGRFSDAENATFDEMILRAHDAKYGGNTAGNFDLSVLDEVQLQCVEKLHEFRVKQKNLMQTSSTQLGSKYDNLLDKDWYAVDECFTRLIDPSRLASLRAEAMGHEDALMKGVIEYIKKYTKRDAVKQKLIRELKGGDASVVNDMLVEKYINDHAVSTAKEWLTSRDKVFDPLDKIHINGKKYGDLDNLKSRLPVDTSGRLMIDLGDGKSIAFSFDESLRYYNTSMFVPSQTERIAGDGVLKAAFGSLENFNALHKQIEQELAEAVQRKEITRSEAKRLSTEFENGVNELRGMRASEDTMTTFKAFGRLAMNTAYFKYGGCFGINQAAETGQVMAYGGLKHIFSAFSPLRDFVMDCAYGRNTMQAIREVDEHMFGKAVEEQVFGMGFGDVSTRMTLEGDGIIAKGLRGANDLATNLGKITSKTSFLQTMTESQNKALREQCMIDLFKAAHFGVDSVGSLIRKPLSEAKLKAAGITEKDFEIMLKNLKEFSEFDGKKFVSFDWDGMLKKDPRSAMQMKSFVMFAMERAVQEGARSGSRNMMKNSNTFVRMALQFKDFTLRCINGQTFRAMTAGDVDDVAALGLSAATNFGVYAARTAFVAATMEALGLREKAQAYRERMFGTDALVRATLTRTGMLSLGLPNDVLEIANPQWGTVRTTVNNKPLRDRPRTAGDMLEDTITQMPTVKEGFIVPFEAGRAMYHFANDDATQSDMRAVLNAVPIANYLFMNALYAKAIEASGLPKKRKKKK